MKTSKKIKTTIFVIFSLFICISFLPQEIYALNNEPIINDGNGDPCIEVVEGEGSEGFEVNESGESQQETSQAPSGGGELNTDGTTQPPSSDEVKVMTIVVRTEQECIDKQVADGVSYNCEYSMADNWEEIRDELEPEEPPTGGTSGLPDRNFSDDPLPEIPNSIATLVNYCQEVTVKYTYNLYKETVDEEYDCKDVPTTTDVDDTNKEVKQECQTRKKEIYEETRTGTITVYGRPNATNGQTIIDFGDTKETIETLYNKAHDHLYTDGNPYIPEGTQLVNSDERFYSSSKFSFVYDNQGSCISATKGFIEGMVRQKLLTLTYHPTNKYYSNFMDDGMFRIDCITFKPAIYSSKDGRYSITELFIKANSSYGYIFEYTEFNAAETLYEAVNNYSPKLVKAVPHITDTVATGKFIDRIIYRDNLSADTFIVNTTNPESQYTINKSSAEYLKLVDTKFTKFNAIRAKSCTGNEYIKKDGTKIILRINEGEAAPLTSDIKDAYGTNVIYSYAYEDQWYQRLFQIEETWNLMFYLCDASGNALEEEYTGLYFYGNVDGECNKTYRALFNIYSNEANDRISKFETTNQGIYDLGTGKENTYWTKRIVKYLVANKFVGLPNAFEDVYTKQLNATKTISGHKRGALYTSYLTAGTISYDNDTIKVNYKLTPTAIKPVKANGVTLGQAIADNIIDGYSISNNGIYVKAQTKLAEWQIGVYNVEPIVSTFSTSYTYYKKNSYSICVGQYNCNCEDIGVLCSCEDEEMGCSPDDVCEDASDPNCKSAYDCSEDPDNPKCECFDGDDEDDCPGNGWIEKDGTPTNPNTNNPGGQTGGGSIDYFNKYYKPSSSLTN